MEIWKVILLAIFILFYIRGLYIFIFGINNDTDFYIVMVWFLFNLGSLIYFVLINNDWLFYKI